MKKASILVFIFLMLNTFCSQAQVAPKYSNEFLAIGVGGRAFAMGNANVASVIGPESPYWNPAAMVSLENKLNLSLMHAEYFAGLANYDFGAVTFKIDEKSAFGVSFIRFGVDNIPNTTELLDNNGNIQFDRIKPFSVADYAFYFSYARNLAVQGLSVGGNVKIIRRVGGDFASAWGFGFDLATRYMYNNWTFALVARDITTTFNQWQFNTANLEEVFLMTGNEIPTTTTEITLPKIIMGTAYNYVITPKFGVLGEINLDISTDGKRNVLIKGNVFSVDPHAGIELNYAKTVFLRLGINNIQNEYTLSAEKFTTVQPNMGLGIKYKRLSLDYALTDLGDISAAGYSHVFNLSFGFDKLAGSPKN